MKEHEDIKAEALRLDAGRGDLERAQNLLSQGADPNGRGADGQSALHRVAREGGAQMIVMFLQYGADPNLADNAGVTPFMSAVNAQQWGNAAFMIDHKADVNFQPSPQSMSPLYRAIVFDAIDGHSERTSFLLRYGANPDAMIELPSGENITMAQWADRCDEKTGRRLFSALFAQYTGRDIRREAEIERLGAEQQKKRMEILEASGRRDRLKFKLGPR